TESRLRPYHFNYPERSLTMEEMLNKFIDEGKREHNEIRALIYDFQTNNELLFKERNNSLIELRFGVQELLNVINNVPTIDCDVKGVTTKGGKATTLDVRDNDTSVPPKEPVVVELEKPAGSNEDLTNDQPQITSNPVVQPSNEVQPPPVPFPKRLKEACKIIINERCSEILLNKLPSKEKDPGSFTIPCDIGQLHIDNALADLGASISLMPYTMYKKLSLGEPKATRMSLKLADRGLEKSIDQSDLKCRESTSNNEKNGSDSENLIRCINSVNTPYPVTQGITNGDNVKSEHLYSASANEIDEKKPELKNLPQHLEYAYLNGDKPFPIII
ncbi:reverse transcriptase domain-containing protein, partial [Tanacetum coccineum]